MYLITYDSGEELKTLYTPTNEATGILSAKLDMEVNRAGKLTLELPPGHPAAGQLVVLKTQVFVYDDFALLWFGRVFSLETDLYGVISVMIEGAQAFLNDVLLRPFTFTGTPGELLAFVIEKYNEGADERRLFAYVAPETAPAQGSPLLTTLKVESTGFRTAWDIVENEILTPTGLRLILDRGELPPAEGQQTPRIGVIARLYDEPPDGGQEIALGKNLLEYRREGSGEDVVTVLIPLGRSKTDAQIAMDNYDPTADSVSPGEPLSGKAAETQVWLFLRQTMGLTVAVSCAILANMYAECGFDQQNIGDKGTSYGLIQWHDSRNRDLRRWCSNHGYDYSTVAGQLAYFQHDLVDNYPSVYRYMCAQPNTAQGAYNAAYYMCVHYEVPEYAATNGAIRGTSASDRFFRHYSAV